jgi:hypothetical protein
LPMIFSFVLLMEPVISCIFLSLVLSCLTNNSSVFPLIPFYLQVLKFCLLLVLVC